MMEKRFIKATKGFCTLEKHIPAPYMRKTFLLDTMPQKLQLSICGLGFYVLYINGCDITKGHLAPYISNPDDCCYYDTYDITEYLSVGKNTVGIILGNGFQNALGSYTWDFDNAAWRSAPRVAFELVARFADEERVIAVADEDVRCYPSPITFDDLRYGEYYDARKEIADWSLPDFDDTTWEKAMVTENPRGELCPCTAEPIDISQTICAQKIIKCRKGYIYDFGINSAGICELRLKNGRAGQKLTFRYAEQVKDGELFVDSTVFKDRFPDYYENNQKDIYISRGVEEEIWRPHFTYHGFRYVLVEGVDDEQAVPELLTFLIMHSMLKKHGDFSCSNQTVNTLFQMVQNADLSNFYYFPTDCPHREKNGWTGDTAVSCAHMMLLYDCEHSFSQWLACVRKSQNDQGAIPGIVPTAGWGYEWGNGPAWDRVIFYLPYECWNLRKNFKIIKDNAHTMIRYLEYILTRRNEDGTVSIGLGDWASVGRRYSKFETPLVVSDSILVMDMANKAAQMFDAVGYTHQAGFAKAIFEDMRKSIRSALLDTDTCTLQGRTQTAQAMGLYYGVFDECEKTRAFAVLTELIHEKNDSFDCGILGLSTVFHVLSEFGESELAFRMITKKEYPSYGHLIELGETALPERFMPDGAPFDSHNHHFFGDIARWFIREIAGLKVENAEFVRISPRAVGGITSAKTYYELPAGRASVQWYTDEDGVMQLEYSCPDGVMCEIQLPETANIKRRLS